MKMRGLTGLLLALALSAGQLMAGSAKELTGLMRFDELFQVLEREGRLFGESLEEDLFPGEGGRRWQGDVARIHEAAKMQALAEADLAQRLEGQPEALARMEGFFASPLGRKITELEIAARVAYLDDEVKQLAERAWHNFGVDLPARVGLLEELVEVNDLIEQNVAGGMNSNMAFYQGMRAGGGLGPDPVPEADMMADLWSQEEAIREETEAWIMPYLAMAYRPLSDAELADYVAFSASPEGRLLNRALFAAFDQVFVAAARELGKAAADRLTGRDI